jgi:copper chaperone NosL
MAFSDQAFASELIAQDGLVYKFDDIGCLEKFKKQRSDVRAIAVFYKDFQSKKWISEDKSIVVRTGIKTPMGSGKIALGDSAQAKSLLEQYPPSGDISENTPGCCEACSNSKVD